LDRLTIKRVKVAAIEPNPWNPNRMSERVFEAEKESILAFGFIDPITVRPAPEGDGYQIIDGEHRFRVLSSLIEDGVPPGVSEDLKALVKAAEVPAIVLDVPDAWAKKLTVILNETRGKADPLALGELLADLAQDGDLDALRKGLPFSEAELEELVKVGEFDWDQFNAGADEPGEPADEPQAERWRKFDVRMPEGAFDLLVQARALITDAAEGKLHKEESIALGQVVEILAAEYLAMPGRGGA
jgi:hypothetical protein